MRFPRWSPGWVALLSFALGSGCAVVRMPLRSYRGPSTPLTEREQQLREALRRDVWALAAEIGERNVYRPKELAAAAGFISQTFSEAGYRVNPQSFEAAGRTFVNVEAVRLGRRRPEEVIVLGSHYDSTPGSPGADDNASGVAALLNLARLFAQERPERTLRFVAFANEEAPFARSSSMGSVAYARRCRANRDHIIAMLNLETMGYYAQNAGSQEYPFPLRFFYPATGNFVTFVSDTRSLNVLREAVARFRERAPFASEGLALPPVPGVGWSDDWAFAQAHYPAFMVTDTGPFRYAWYHRAGDTPDKLDYDGLARVVAGLATVVAELAGGPELASFQP